MTLAKPTGAICNLNCSYCYFLAKEELYPDSPFRMSDEAAREYLRQMVTAHPGPEVQITWQGGEPTMMGLDFFRKTVQWIEEFRRPGLRVEQAIQTNGTLLTDEWCEFLKQNDFLVGISIDGPRDLHDAYRVNKAGRGSFDAVMRGLDLLRRHGVRWNVLTTVHAANERRGADVYRFQRDELGAQFIQYIPIVELPSLAGVPYGDAVTERSVSPAGFGRFLIDVFDEWVRCDVGTVFVQAFDSALASWVGVNAPMCVQAETCGTALAVEHTGDVYSCDHYVEPEYLLGNLLETDLAVLASDPRQRAFGDAKRRDLPDECRACPVRFACNGGCPKDRIVPATDGQLNYLCESYRSFFERVDKPMRFMTGRVRSGGDPRDVMAWTARQDAKGRKPQGRDAQGRDASA